MTARLENMEEAMYRAYIGPRSLDHSYHGIAYPLHLGGKVEWDEPETISGVFHEEDFQDGAGVTLYNGEGKLWMVPKKILREHGWPKLIR